MFKHFRYNTVQGDWPIVIVISLVTTFTVCLTTLSSVPVSGYFYNLNLKYVHIHVHDLKAKVPQGGYMYVTLPNVSN